MNLHAYMHSCTRGLTKSQQKALDGSYCKPNMFVWDPSSLTTAKPIPGEIPWPIAFVLGSFSKKYIFASKAPSLTDISRSLSSWIQKLRWKQAMEDKDENGLPKIDPWRSLRSKLPVRTCPLVTDHSRLEQALGPAADVIFQALRTAVFGSGGSRGNFNGAAKLGFRMLARSDYIAIPTDKDGGYAWCRKSLLHDHLQGILSVPTYVPCEFNIDQKERINSEYEEVCSAIAEAEFAIACDKESRRNAFKLKNALMRDVSRMNEPMLDCVIQFNVKTHKKPGECKLRVIHASHRSPHKPLQRYLAGKLRRKIDVFGHLLRDTHDLKRKICGCDVSSKTFFVKLDVKDFYMTGQHDQIISNCLVGVVQDGIVPPELKNPFEKGIKFVLKNQFVVMSSGNRKAWHVKRGSGMGLIASDEMANLDFFEIVEATYVLRPEVIAEYGIVVYLRYKDDILLGLDCDEDSRTSFLAEFRRRAAPYILKEDESSYTSVAMLDVVISKSVHSSVQLSMYSKPTVQGIPLCSTSMHSGGVHRSWPTARFLHYDSICTEVSDSNIAKLRFIRKMKRLVPEHAWLRSQHLTRMTKRPVKGDSSWVVMPFHRSFDCCLVKTAVTKAQAFFAHLHISELGPRISWCNGYRSIQARVGALYHDFIANSSLSCGDS